MKYTEKQLKLILEAHDLDNSTIYQNLKNSKGIYFGYKGVAQPQEPENQEVLRHYKADKGEGRKTRKGGTMSLGSDLAQYIRKPNLSN